MDAWPSTPFVGQMVCTCRMDHVAIAEVDDDGDTVTTVDGWRCSYRHCCDPVDHEWSHDDLNTRWPPPVVDVPLPDEDVV